MIAASVDWGQSGLGPKYVPEYAKGTIAASVDWGAR